MDAGNYPHRKSATKAAYRQHIIDVLRWKDRRYGEKTWDGVVVEELGKRGLDVAREMAAEGLVTLKMGTFKTPGGNIGSRAFGRSGWVEPEVLETFVLGHGPAFPAVEVA